MGNEDRGLLLYSDHAQKIVTKRGRRNFIEPRKCFIGEQQRRRTAIAFNGKLRDELLNGEIFYSLKEAQIVIE